MELEIDDKFILTDREYKAMLIIIGNTYDKELKNILQNRIVKHILSKKCKDIFNMSKF